MTKPKKEIFANILTDMLETYVAKNDDYGSAFAKLRTEYPDAVLVRIFDKYLRLKTLMEREEGPSVKDEPIEDTLLDLANYCILELVERKATGNGN